MENKEELGQSPLFASMIGAEISVLDHGFVRLVDFMGNDASIVQAARVSYGSGTKQKRTDIKLINYLIKNLHRSPIEMCEIKLHIKCPIFVARQWMRHRTASINEYSARYSEVAPDFYVPSICKISGQHETNKQSRKTECIPENNALKIQQLIKSQSEQCFSTYKDLLSFGVARELARCILPVNAYTEFYWKIDLSNLFNFISLRIKEDAQYEIRAYAEKIFYEIVCQWVPVAAHAFKENILDKTKQQ